MIEVGDTLYGYCAGCFGEVYKDKVVVAIESKWIVVKEFDSDRFYFHTSDNIRRDLTEYLQPKDTDYEEARTGERR